MDEPFEPGRGKSLVSFIEVVPPFIDYEQQLGWPERCLQEAIADRPQVTLIQGEAGDGKTRLLKEL